MSMVTAMAAALLGFNAPAPVDQNPCGVVQARQLIAFAAYSDKTTHRVNVEPGLDLEIYREGDGPVVIRDATSHAAIYSLARSEFDGYVPLPNGKLPESDGTVAKVVLGDGTLIVDPSSTLSRNGAWVFVCWKAKSSPVEHSRHHVERYSGIELSDDGTHLIRRTDGSSIALPQFRYQVEIEATRVSDDGKRVGWLVDLPNCCTSYPVPILLVIFKDRVVEKVTEVGQCIFDWAFVRHGTAVSYYQSTLHGTDYRGFTLRDIRTDAVLATYEYPDSNESPESEAERAAAVAAAPDWVRAIPSSRTD
jgi:hypothetical protein